MKDQFWEEPIFHGGAIRAVAQTFSRMAPRGHPKRYFRIYRAVVFPGAEPLAKCGQHSFGTGVVREWLGWARSNSPEGSTGTTRVSHGCWPQLTLTRSGTERCERPASFRTQSHLLRGGLLVALRKATRHRFERNMVREGLTLPDRSMSAPEL